MQCNENMPGKSSSSCTNFRADHADVCIFCSWLQEVFSVPCSWSNVYLTLLRPVPVGFFCAGHGLVGSSPQLGMGPLELPSHSSQPIAQPTIIVCRYEHTGLLENIGACTREKLLPLLNQKQACPFFPDSVPFSLTTGHHPVMDSTLGGFLGTGPFQGARSLSTALRGGGLTTAPANKI